MTEYQQKNLDLARVNKLIHRMEGSRLKNQEWKCRSQVREEELQQLCEHLNVAEDAPLRLQRHPLSAHQQRSMFIREMLGKIDKLEGYRMQDQDAELLTIRKEEDLMDLRC
ncbi:hypothetical protein K493DRAFT_335818, partial [Basidiobolus meristosporus CBS 931.73]